MITTPVDSTTPDGPAAKAKGTVNPSDIPMTMSRIFSEEVKCVSTCGVCGMPSPRERDGARHSVARYRNVTCPQVMYQPLC